MNISSIKQGLAPVKDFFQKPEVKKALIITGVALLALTLIAAVVASFLINPVAAPAAYFAVNMVGLAAGISITGVSIAFVGYQLTRLRSVF